MIEYEHLHTHSHFSLLDGLSNIRQMCEVALEQGQSSVCVTDHGSIAGIPDLFRTARDYGLKPIAGMEAYFCEDVKIKDKTSDTFHLTLIARNLKGYKNLCNLVTRSYAEGFYRKPRIDIEMLRDHQAGIIVLSGCMNSIIANSILKGDHEKAEALAFEMQESLPSFYLEYMDHGIKAQKALNLTYDRWMRKNKWKGVVTQDSHYLFEEDSHAHQTLLCVGTRSTVKEPRFKFDGGPYHYCTGEHLSKKFDMRLIKASKEIAEQCESYDVPSSGSMPEVPRTLLNGKSPNQFLEEVAWAGFKNRGLRGSKYVDRLRYELTVVYKLKYASYFIMVNQITKWARSQRILVGPGRGSSAGSLLAYCLQITDIDPIRYGLYFERFLNENRISPPDIDVDIADSGRQDVLRFIRETYGEKRVAHIGSFSTMGPFQSIRDVAIAHGMAFDQVNHALKQAHHDPMITFDEVSRMSAVTDNFSEKIIAEARVMSGKPRHMSTHAAGIIIANHDLHDHMPMVTREGVYQTMYDMDQIANMGYTKFDILGLKALGIIDKVIKKATIKKAELKEMNEFNDEKVYQMLSDGHTMGVFQLEGWGCTQMVKRYKPRSFEDIMMINALYRPGPMQGGEGLEVILRRRNEEEDIVFKHPDLEPILGHTYGMPVFQEQVMRMCQVLAGFTLGEADTMRSAIGKKDEVKLAAQRTAFIRGCISKGHNRAFADEIFEDITFFNRYGWNRAHAAAYGAVTYYTAWLKTYYKEYFLAELLNAEDDPERTSKLIRECIRMDIEIERVDLNRSVNGYAVDWRTKVLIPGFTTIKGIGDKAAQAIIDERYRGGNFYSKTEVRDRIARKLLNKVMFEAIEKAGAFKNLPNEYKSEVPF